MFDIIVREAASRFGLGDRAATLVQTVVAYVINKDTGGIAGLVQRFRDAGLGDIAQSWVSGGTQAQAMTTDQSEVMFGQKGGLLDMVTSKLGISREVALPALAYILPSVIGKLTPSGSIPTNVPDEVHQFVGTGTASDIAGRSHMAGSSDGSGLWKWLALLAAGVLAVLLLMKCSDTENPVLPSENIAPVETVTDAVGAATDSVVDGAANALEQTGDAVGDVAENAGNVVGEAADALTDGASSAVEKTGDVAGDAVDAAQKLGDAAADAADKTVEGATDAVEKAGDAVGGAAEKALDGASEAVDKTSAAASSAVDATADAANAAKNAIASLFVDTSKDVLKQASDDKKVQLAERDGTPVLKVFFDTGKYAVNPAFKDFAADVVTRVGEKADTKVVVQGFSDPSGNAAANEELSKNRAKAVRDALLALDIADDRIELRKPNSTVPEGGSYEEMRRVEVTVEE